MDVFRGLGRLALLVAALAASTLTFAAATASGQNEQAACSDGIDNDSDGAIDGADAGCGGGDDRDETDSPYAGVEFVTLPLPLVTLQGSVFDNGDVKVTKLQVRALRGTTVRLRCIGKRCPVKQSQNIMITNALRLKRFEKRLKPPLMLDLRIQRNGDLGKFVRYKLRRNAAPEREDDCLDQLTEKRRPCYVG